MPIYVGYLGPIVPPDPPDPPIPLPPDMPNDFVTARTIPPISLPYSYCCCK